MGKHKCPLKTGELGHPRPFSYRLHGVNFGWLFWRTCPAFIMLEFLDVLPGTSRITALPGPTPTPQCDKTELRFLDLPSLGCLGASDSMPQPLVVLTFSGYPLERKHGQNGMLGEGYIMNTPERLRTQLSLETGNWVSHSGWWSPVCSHQCIPRMQLVHHRLFSFCMFCFLVIDVCGRSLNCICCVEG